MATSTVTSKGQITIPIEVRRALKLEPGSRVEFVALPDGSYELMPATRSIKELKGIVKYSGPPVSIEDMNEAIASAAADRFRR
ncbi:MAG: AbrB/MazE/SpoVT family DNA-binding domain-containing protein [Aeromicrobium sp.]